MKRALTLMAALIIVMGLFILEGTAEEKITPGMEIKFGCYKQTEYGIDNTPVSWIVLDVEEDGTVLAISKYILGYHLWDERWYSSLDLTITEEDMPGYAYSTRLLRLDEAETYGLGAGTPTAYALANKKYKSEDRAYQNTCWWVDLPYTGDDWQRSWDYSHSGSIGCYINENGDGVKWVPGSAGGYGAGVDFGFRPALVLTPAHVVPEISLWMDEKMERQVKYLDYCEGNLLAANFIDHNSIFFLLVEAKGGRGKQVKIEIPKGFSFSKETANDQDRYIEEILGVDERIVHPVYSIYNVQSINNVVFRAEVDEIKALDISVKQGLREIIDISDSNISDYTGYYKEIIDEGWVNSYINGVPYGYEQKLANLGVYLSFSVYDQYEICNSLHNLGFHRIKYIPMGGVQDGADFCMGIKTMTNSSGINTRLAIIVVRGTIGKEEWIGNFVVGNTDNAWSFDAAARKIVGIFEEYLEDNGLTKNNVAVYSCGHSRGAAIANNISHMLTESHAYLGVTGYTFATPNTTKTPNSNDKIYNFMYANDVAPYVPQGYYNHGETYVFGLSDHIPTEVKTVYKRHTFRDYEAVDQDLIIGGIITVGERGNSFLGKGVVAGNIQYNNVENNRFANNAHSGENYVSWVTTKGRDNCVTYDKALSTKKREFKQKCKALTLDKVNSIIPIDTVIKLNEKMSIINQKKGVHVTSVQCPVDVLLKDSQGNTIIEIRDHTVVNCDNTNAYAITEGTTDFLVYPADQGYYLDIEGNDRGKMKLAINSIGKEGNLIDRTVIDEIPIKESEHYVVEPEYGKLSSMQIISSTGETFGEETTPPLRLPAGPTSLPDKLFAGDQTLQGVLIIPEGVESIGSKVFEDTKIVLLILPKSIKSIADDAFKGMHSSVQFRCPRNSMAEGWLMDHGLSYTTY